MIAVDTSSLVAFIGDERGADVDLLKDALVQHQIALPPPVLAEVLSDPKLALPLRESLLKIPLLEIREGYWERSGLLRGRILSLGYKAYLADTLIAQSCIDHNVALITRDSDFRHFARAGGLKLL